jgi:hypothetical protein
VLHDELSARSVLLDASKEASSFSSLHLNEKMNEF